MLLAAIVASSDDAIISKDLHGIITSWNPSAERLFGYRPDEVLGQSVLMLIPDDRQGEELIIRDRIQNAERLNRYETVRRRKDGSLVAVSLTVSPILDAQGRVVGASVIARDITAQKRAEAELRKAQQGLRKANQDLEQAVSERTAKLQEALGELDAFSYSVSHDLRAPLRAMQGHARLVLEDYARHLPPEARHYLERIAVNATRLDQLVQDVLTYSRIIRGEVKAEPVNVDKLLGELLEQYSAFQPPNAEITLEKPLPPVLGHEGSVMQCLLNLISNAIKFIAPGVKPKVNIRSERRDRQVRIWVEDNGIGIAAENVERIFRLFERVYPESTYEGTGLGLAIVRKAAERMGGRAGVESEPGRGSRFWIQLPAAPDGAQGTEPRLQSDL